MDMQMPVMDGLTATRRIRSDHRFDHLVIIALTANAQVEFRDQCLKAGMNDFATKPIDPTTLFATVAHWIEVSRRPVDAPPLSH
jgi:CheY-like chemotaxis protein